MGQTQSLCCQKDHKISSQLLVTMKNLNEPQQNGQRTDKAYYDSRLLQSAKIEDFFKCQKVAVPQKNVSVAHTLSNLNPLKPLETYEKGIYKPDFYRFDNTRVVYNGQWKDKVPHGFGSNYYPNQNYYEGTFVQGIPHGFGRFISSNGDYYEGEIKYGRANGFGYYQNQNFNYRGEFKDNLKHGKGVQRTPQSYFEGDFQYDQKKKGLLKYADSTYEGTFNGNTFNGKGKLTNTKGVYIGQFKNGQQNGYGQFTWKDGSIYRGYFKNGVRDGDGQYYNSRNYSTAKGYWKNGVLNGNGQYFQPNGVKHRCIWQNSKIKSIIQ